ncbi:uncharacterized protein LOC127810128 isoform X2 [Diospyros lotus]|nr:uncharacterized protein LOC127810128 isoform X2 [Diospyros lotus]
MENTPPFSSPLDSDFSTGYLQDALFEFGDRSKRRRLMLFADSQFKETNEPLKSYWDSSQTENCSENFSYLSQITSFNGVSGEALMYGSMSRMSGDGSVFTITEKKTAEGEEEEEEQEISAASDQALHSSASSHHKPLLNTSSSSFPLKQTLSSLDPISTSPDGDGEKRKQKVAKKRVAYPFAVVKPGGWDGDVTLNDINNRILMPPTRPVRHPVGDYACRPLVSPDGPGLSGKAVVAFTRIHTQGRGTITIIRTKG